MTKQPLPIPNNNPHIADLVIADIQERKAFGIQKYHTALQAMNGRSALQDLYEELIDATQYTKQQLEEDNLIHTAYLICTDALHRILHTNELSDTKDLALKALTEQASLLYEGKNPTTDA